MKYQEVVSLVNGILAQYREATIRQIYYRLVSPPYQYMANTQSMYTSFDKMLTRARECGDVDWQKIVDRSRSVIRASNGWASPEAFLDAVKDNVRDYHKHYFIDMWAKQDYTLKVLVEKDALGQIVADEALAYQVDVVPGRGYNSFTQLKQQAVELVQRLDVDKSIVILYFGDFDPSGLDIDRSAGERLELYSGLDFDFVRVALTEADLQGLPPNPTKVADTRARAYVAKYGDRCWELDALPPDQLRARVRSAIESYVDEAQWDIDLERLECERDDIKRELQKLLN